MSVEYTRGYNQAIKDMSERLKNMNLSLPDVLPVTQNKEPAPKAPKVHKLTLHVTIGADECGRGVLFGPLVAGVACVFTRCVEIMDQTIKFPDSKTVKNSQIIKRLVHDARKLPYVAYLNACVMDAERIVSCAESDAMNINHMTVKMIVSLVAQLQNGRRVFEERFRELKLEHKIDVCKTLGLQRPWNDYFDEDTLKLRPNIDIKYVVDTFYLDMIGSVETAHENVLTFESKLCPGFLDNTKFVIESKADGTYSIVGLASIQARYTELAEIETLAQKYPILKTLRGSPGDLRTKEYLREYYEKHGSFPAFVRTNWSTCTSILREVELARCVTFEQKMHPFESPVKSRIQEPDSRVQNDVLRL